MRTDLTSDDREAIGMGPQGGFGAIGMAIDGPPALSRRGSSGRRVGSHELPPLPPSSLHPTDSYARRQYADSKQARRQYAKTPQPAEQNTTDSTQTTHRPADNNHLMIRPGPPGSSSKPQPSGA